MILEIVLLVMAAAGLYEGIRLSKSTLLFTDPVGPGWYLFFMSCLLFACALALLVKELLARRKTDHREVGLSLHRGPAGQALILLFLYGVATTFLGYLIASAIFFVLVQRIFGERSWVRCTVVGLSITGCFYFVFSYLAGMPLP